MTLPIPLCVKSGRINIVSLQFADIAVATPHPLTGDIGNALRL